MNQQHKIIVVGATSGLGRMLAECYIRDGHVVGIVGCRGDKLAEVAEGHPEVYLAALASEMGGLDLLVLCSGVGRMNPDLDYGLELPTVDTNVRGWTAVADWAFSFFMRQGYGHLAAISSVAGIRGLAPAPAYSASKAYQIHYLEALRQRARIFRKKVCVTDVRPGFVRTPLLSHPEMLFWVDEPEKAVKAIYRAISARKKKAVITRRWAFLVPWMRIAPEWLVAKILGKA